MIETLKEKRFLRCGILIAALTLIDQITKAAAASLGDKTIRLIPGVLEFLYLENAGAAFGLLKNRQALFIALAVLFFAAAGYFIAVLPGSRHYAALEAVAAVMTAGACGNLLDRVFLGSVRDFIYIRLIDFPVFNFADILVTVSAAVLFVLIMTVYKDDDFSFLKDNLPWRKK